MWLHTGKTVFYQTNGQHYLIMTQSDGIHALLSPSVKNQKLHHLNSLSVQLYTHFFGPGLWYTRALRGLRARLGEVSKVMVTAGIGLY